MKRAFEIERYYWDVSHRDLVVDRAPDDPLDLKAWVWAMTRMLLKRFALWYNDPQDAESDAGLAVAQAHARWKPEMGRFDRYVRLLAFMRGRVRRARWRALRERSFESLYMTSGQRQRLVFRRLQKQVREAAVARAAVNLGGAR